MKVVTLARKPLEGSLLETIAGEGTGGLNADVCRIPLAEGETISVGFNTPIMHEGWKRGWMHDPERWSAYKAKALDAANTLGRWPPNLVVVGDVRLPESLQRMVRQVGA